MIQRRAAPATGTKEKLTTVFRVVKPAVGGVKLPPPSSSPKLPDGYRFAILALTVKLWLAVLCARLLKGRWLFVGLACCHGVSPVSVPLSAMQQGIHGEPSWAGTLSVSQSGAFSDCVTRFRGGALRHA